MKKLYHLFLSLPLAVFYACGPSDPVSQLPSRNEAIPVSVMPIQRGNFSDPIATSGNFTTKDETILSFKVGGIISSIGVEEGDQIRKGQLLATLDKTEVESGLTQASLAFEKAQRDYQRAKNLYQDSVVTLEILQNSQTAMEIAEQQVKTARFNSSHAEIRATQDGFVLRKNANPGQQVGPGTPILQINGAGRGEWVLQAYVNDQNWTLIQVGDKAVITLENHPDEIPGVVLRKSQSADPVTGVFGIDIKPDPASSMTLASGMFGKAKLFPSRQASGWEIPYKALLDAQGNEGYVFVTEGENKAKKVKVRLGRISPNSVQVTGGLEEYSSLIVSGSAYLSDGSTILISGK